MAKHGQNYDASRPSRGEELDERFGMIVVKMRRAVEAYQTNDKVTVDRISAELSAEISELDRKVQLELTNYVQNLVLDELIPVATLFHAGAVGKGRLKLTKLVLKARQLKLPVSRNFKETVLALPDAALAKSKDAANEGQFDLVKRLKALADEIRQATPKTWTEPRPAKVTGELEARGLQDVPGTDESDEPEPGNIADPVLSAEEMDRIAGSQVTGQPRD